MNIIVFCFRCLDIALCFFLLKSKLSENGFFFILNFFFHFPFFGMYTTAQSNVSFSHDLKFYYSKERSRDLDPM